MLSFISWYLVLLLVGLSVIPISFRFFAYLPDRGYAFLRPLGLILWGYLFWILGSLRILPNTLGGQITASLVLLGVSFWLARGNWTEIITWLKRQWKSVLVVEILFLLLFAGWAIVRSANPNITGTEKPMEMAFISSIMRSPTFPPSDPWLSGYAISYYYFGYVLVAMLGRAAGTSIGVTFNLAIALWFALTGIAAYGVLYNLINQYSKARKSSSDTNKAVYSPLLGPLYILFFSNLEGFLEFFHAKGLFWGKAADGAWQSRFWSWLKIAELNLPPSEPFSWLPNRMGGILWWRASRVIQDYKLQDVPHAAVNPAAPIEIIDEFPFFSYLLADLHPHVLVMPFALLAVGIALNLYFSGTHRLNAHKVIEWVQAPRFWLGAILLGGLGFLNIWDFPIYVGLLSLTYGLMRVRQSGWKTDRIMEVIKYAFVYGLAGLILYLPFYLGFDSQAGGLMPSLLFFTRGINFWVMFTPLLIPIFLWLGWMVREKSGNPKWKAGLNFALIILGGLWAIMMIMSVVALSLSAIGNSVGGTNMELGQRLISWGQGFWGLQGGNSPGELLIQSILRRLISPGTWVTLGAMLIIVWALLGKTWDMDRVEGSEISEESKPAGVVLLLVLLGVALTLIPEFVYLRDQFGTRMNTIFKFYFQAWIVWGIAAGYATIVLFTELRGKLRTGFTIAWAAVLIMALAYPVYMLPVRMDEGGLELPDWRLDGTEYISQYNPDEAEAITWLKQAPDGVLVEAVGVAYSNYGRISVQTGLPTVIGWANHESQWRGGYEEIGSRPDDVKSIYSSPIWDETLLILTKYQVRYIYIGGMERGTYDVVDIKFQKYLKPVFQNATVTIYEVPELITAKK